MFYNLIFVTILSFVVRSTHSIGCHMRLRDSVAPEQSPIYLKRDISNKFNLLIPDDRGISLNVGEEIFLACADSGNRFLLNRSVDIQPAYCIEGTNLNIFGRTHSFNEIKCVNPIQGSIYETNTPCGKTGGVIKYIGFSVNSGKDFVDLIRSCYDSHTGEAMFASHILYYPKVWEVLKQRPYFGTSGAGREVNVIKAYKQVTQKTTFKKLLGLDSSKYISASSYLSRGHLAPSADFPIATWKAATFYFINVVPQWAQVNARNWEQVERKVRNLAYQYHENLYIISGAYDILTLPDVNGKETAVYLDRNDKIPVPKYLWKIVLNPKTHQGIVFVALNNPFEEEVKSLDFCSDICKEANFVSQDWSNAKDGLVICCSVDDFNEKINYLPDLGRDYGLLTNI